MLLSTHCHPHQLLPSQLHKFYIWLISAPIRWFDGNVASFHRQQLPYFSIAQILYLINYCSHLVLWLNVAPFYTVVIQGNCFLTSQLQKFSIWFISAPILLFGWKVPPFCPLVNYVNCLNCINSLFDLFLLPSCCWFERFLPSAHWPTT